MHHTKWGSSAHPIPGARSLWMVTMKFAPISTRETPTSIPPIGRIGPPAKAPAMTRSAPTA